MEKELASIRIHSCFFFEGIIRFKIGWKERNNEHTSTVSDGPDFPPQFLPLAKAQGKVLDEITKGNHIQERISVVRK